MAQAAESATQRTWHQTRSLLLLREVMDLGGTLRREIADRVDLSETEMRALEHVARHEMGPAELARALDVSTAASTGIVDRLEAKGHVARTPHADDRRRTQVVMTAHARGEVMNHMGGMFAALALLDASLTDDERAVVERYLAAAIDAVRATLEPAHHAAASGRDAAR
jgi:DNA-binding MarR family transcriptional regulator